MRKFRRAIMAVAIGAVAIAIVAPGSTEAEAVTPLAPLFHGSVLKHAKVGRAFHATVAAKGRPVAAITATTALPAGFTFTDLGIGRGTLAGTFAVPGTFVIGFQATNTDPATNIQWTATESLTVTVTGIAAVSTYCGQRTGAPATSKVMVIYEENHSYSSIIGSASAPTINSYAQSCGKATNYQALTHPSLPNYMASTSGVSYASSPWSSDCSPSVSCSTANNNIFNQVGPTHWKSYAESMTSNCSGSGPSVASRHIPAEYYTNLASSCATNVVPLGTTTSGALHADVAAGTIPTFTTVTPNQINNMHDGTITQGDNWLSTWIPVITSGPDYQSGHLTILIVWDEGSGSGNIASTVAMLAISPYVVPGTSSATAFTHYSLLKAAEDVAGVSELGLAATANSLRTAFGF
ncbi:MAG: alkaline phosphatase family protein [Acidimicrobiales bacterium]